MINEGWWHIRHTILIHRYAITVNLSMNSSSSRVHRSGDKIFPFKNTEKFREIVSQPKTFSPPRWQMLRIHVASRMVWTKKKVELRIQFLDAHQWITITHSPHDNFIITSRAFHLRYGDFSCKNNFQKFFINRIDLLHMMIEILPVVLYL